MKHLAIFGLLAGLLLMAVGCTHTTRYSVKDPPAEGSAKAPTHHEVGMLEFRYHPESLNVSVGDSVTWVNHGRLPHTTTSGVNGKPDGKWDSPHIGRGGRYSYVFSEPGVYHYYCIPHHGLGMKGVVVVTKP